MFIPDGWGYWQHLTSLHAFGQGFNPSLRIGCYVKIKETSTWYHLLLLRTLSVTAGFCSLKMSISSLYTKHSESWTLHVCWCSSCNSCKNRICVLPEVRACISKARCTFGTHRWLLIVLLGNDGTRIQACCHDPAGQCVPEKTVTGCVETYNQLIEIRNLLKL